MTATPVYVAAKTEDGNRSMAVMPGVSNNRINTKAVGGGTAHRVAKATAVSYGGMFYLDSGGTDTLPTLICSGKTVGYNGSNYLFWYTKATGVLACGQNSEEFVGYTVTYDDWVHYAVVENAGRTSATLYINGSPVSTITRNGGVVSSTDRFYVGELANQTNTKADGWASDIFVCNTALTDEQVATFAANAGAVVA